MVVFGITGDLARKKLIPALYELHRQGALDDYDVIGFGRRPWTDDTLRQELSAAVLGANQVRAHQGNSEKEDLASFLKRWTYTQGDFDEGEAYKTLASRIDTKRQVVHSLSTPPEQYMTIAGRLAEAGLAGKSVGGERRLGTRIIVEKPFGRDGESAAALSDFLSERFEERDIFRIDHYLGKETVQNIATLRFGNTVFEPVWNNRYVDRVEITVAESVGVGTRAGYYEHAGALRDMVQNHLFQLMALTAMEPPSSLGADAIRDEKVKVFRALRRMDEAALLKDVVRARYTEGVVDGEAARAYLDEAGIAPDSTTETYVAMKLFIDSWRWSGVPFILRTGKRLSRRLSEIAVHFKAPPLRLFPGAGGDGNVLVFRIQPDEGVTFYLDTKIPGLNDRSRRVSMDFLYGTGSAVASPDAYERLILDALSGDGTLYTRRDEVDASWAFIDPILRLWAKGNVPMASYPAGSSGPVAARAIAGGSKEWRRL